MENDRRDGRDSRGSLPVGVEVAWGLRERPGKGPKPGLSVDRIVEAAIGLADAEGLAAVSMGRVAKELGASTMSLYRYVLSKEELLVLMQETAYGPPPPPGPEAGWREALGQWAWTSRAALQRHLWLLYIPISGPPATPNSVAWMEQGLAALRSTRLAPGEKLAIILLLNGHVTSEARTMAEIGAAIAATGATAGEVMAEYSRLLARLADSRRFPEVAALVASGVLTEGESEGEDGSGEGEGADADFAFGLERVLDGIEVLVRARDRERETGRPPSAD